MARGVRTGFILLIPGLILVLGQNLRLSVVLMNNVFFPIFLRHMPKVIRCQMDPPRLPLPQYDRHPKEYSVHGRRKISNCAANSEFFMKKPPVEAFNGPFEELDHEDDIWNAGTRPTYFQEAVDTDLFRDIRKKILSLKAEEIARVFSTVIPRDQKDTELYSRKGEKIFEEQKDTTLSCKLVKEPPVRGQFGEAFIELREGYKANKQRPSENKRQKHQILRNIIERNLTEFGWIEGCLTSEWCCAPFTVPKPPPADQNTIDGWRMVVDFRNLNAETKADSHPLPLIEEEIAKRARGRLFSVLDTRHGLHQMLLRKDSRPLTYMCTPCGPVQWMVMPIGLRNAPSFCQRMIEDALFTAHPDFRAFVSVYIDDIIIATEREGLTKEELVALHEKQLNKVMDILLVHANRTLFCVLNAQKKTGSQQGKKTIFLDV